VPGERDALDERTRAELQTMKDERDELRRKLFGGQGAGQGLEAQSEKTASARDALLAELGLEKKSLPPREWSSYTDYNRNVRFIAAATRGRDPAAVAAALARNDALDGLLQTKSVQPHLKALVGDVLRIIQDHWSARLGVILMSEVHTSRSEYDTLRHLLSFIYDHDKDLYERIIV
jgi:hypothetical protein